jgi:predicted PurR-regulated permease PerM
MSIPVKKQSVADSLGTISSVLLTAFVIAALYFGRELLVPLALAALLTFLLAPLVTRLERWLGRTGSVIFVVLIIFSTTIFIGWVLSRQAVDLVGKLPDYKDNIQRSEEHTSELQSLELL